ncbi:MAG TPA: hypothetical protein VGS58_18140 [Candidatus Sulfopaludibacter sp.]|nr:hypothetical protein [Candidatus Sulfopaludibacter sp.]
MKWRMAAVLVCLAGAAQAQSPVYRYYVPRAGAVSKVEWSSPGAGWDVSVRFDRERCEILCAYRRLRDPFGALSPAHNLLPPATVIRIYRGGGSAPETVIVDPAGARYPRAGRPVRQSAETMFVAGRSMAAEAGPGRGRGACLPAPEAPTPPAGTARTSPLLVPLRV